MPEQQELDPLAILAALGVTGALEATPVSGGADTAIWRVEDGRQLYALRVFRAEQATTFRREIASMRAAQAGGLPVPAIHAAGGWRDRPALLLGWCVGEPLLSALRRQPARTWRLGLAFGRMQAAIHTVAPAPDPELPPDWISWTGADEPALQARLQALAGHSERLLHLDYHPLNVMTDGRRMTAVLDWANARRRGAQLLDPGDRAILAAPAGCGRLPHDPRAGLAPRLRVGRRTVGRYGALLRLGWRGHAARLGATGRARRNESRAGAPLDQQMEAARWSEDLKYCKFYIWELRLVGGGSGKPNALLNLPQPAVFVKSVRTEVAIRPLGSRKKY